MKINWTRIKEVLHNLADDSGANTDYARGCIVTVAACLTALGMDWRTIWSHLIPNLPNSLRVSPIPTVWLTDLKDDWKLPFSKLVSFETLISNIPQDMRKIVLDEYGWTCRDVLLDKYLYVLAMLQRETEREYAKWKDDWMQDDEPKLRYNFTDFQRAGSQYIAEWAVSDARKERREAINWHGQNTSQWVYAGALCVQDGMVSIHT